MPFIPFSVFGLPSLLLIAAVFVFGRQRKMHGVLAPLVVQQWWASNEPDANGWFVHIRGRNAGILAWMLTALELDENISVSASEGRVEFEISSISGKKRSLIPLSSISSIEYGYHKPWKNTALIFVFAVIFVSFLLNAFTNTNGVASLIGGIFFATIIASVYYILNRNLRLGIWEHSGQFNGIRFKRSIVENKEISEVQAGYVCLLLQTLIENERAKQIV